MQPWRSMFFYTAQVFLFCMIFAAIAASFYYPFPGQNPE